MSDLKKNAEHPSLQRDFPNSEALIQFILDDSDQMIQLSDLETMTIQYANAPAIAYAGRPGQSYQGQKCYEYLMGLDKQCPFCPLLRQNDRESAETEVDNGKEIYAVRTQLVSWRGKQASLEYAREITELRRSQKIFDHQMEALLESIPETQGLLHFDVTADRCLRISGCGGGVNGRETVDDTVRSIAAFVPDGQRRETVFHAFCREALLGAYDHGSAQVTQETECAFRDGSIRPVRIIARLLVNPATNHLECVFYGADISEEKKKKAADEESFRRQLYIFDALGRDYLSICMVNVKKQNVQVLKKQDHTGWLPLSRTEREPYEKACRLYISAATAPEKRGELMESMQLEKVTAALRERPEYSFTYEICLYGQRHDCQIKYLRTEDPEHLLMTFRFVDEIIAEEKQRQEDLKKAMTAAEQAYLAAEHANQAKTTFLNSMSHDIRTPMNAILGFTALASTHVDQPKLVTDYLKKIMASSNHLLSLINDVLDMSRIESGKMKIEERECNLSVVIHDLRNMLQADIRDKRLDLFIDTLDVVDEDVVCDRLRLNQILINILGNAIKFTNPGGSVSLRILQRETAPADYADFDFIIRDNGIGMSQAFAAHIFEPFSREENSAVSRIPGTGLGMAITKNLVDMMNGTISVKSELGKGSEFTVSFRFLKGSHPTGRRGLKELVGLRALVADDSTDTCLSTSKMLKTIGMRADWTISGKEAVIRAKAAKEENDAYKVYIIDWLIPDLNGVEVVRRIRREVGGDASIIILTAYDWSDIEAEAREAGVTAFCAKPLFLSELYSVLQDASSADPETAEEEETEPVMLPDEFRGRRVLLVDDVELNREIAEAILQEAGIQVESASNGEEALHMLTHAAPGYFDLILMDVMMPVMDGYEATRRIRKLPDPKLAGIPVIAMTANAFEEDRQAALDAGMNEHLAKPFKIETLHDVMRRFIL